MNRIFIIADTHFGEDAIRRYENRPFESVAEMDKKLMENWNAAVGKDDAVFVLGDFGADGKEEEILSALNGTKLLVKGNHDVKPNEFYRSAGFAEVYDYPILYKGFWLFSHEPIYVNENMPYANVFGHVHKNPIIADYSSQHFCVSVERINYTPILFDEIKQKIKEAAKNDKK